MPLSLNSTHSNNTLFVNLVSAFNSGTYPSEVNINDYEDAKVSNILTLLNSNSDCFEDTFGELQELYIHKFFSFVSKVNKLNSDFSGLFFRKATPTLADFEPNYSSPPYYTLKDTSHASVFE